MDRVGRRIRPAQLVAINDRLSEGIERLLSGAPLNPCATTYHSLEILPACRWLGVLYAREVTLELGDQLIVRAAGQHLGNVGAAWTENLAGELEAGVDQRHCAQMAVCWCPTVLAAMSDRTRSAWPAQLRLQPLWRGLVHEVQLQDGRAVNGRSASRSIRRCLPAELARGRPGSSRRVRSEIDDSFDPLQEAEALIELQQFVGGTAPVILALARLRTGR